MRAREIMTPDPWVTTMDADIADAASTMAREDIGMLPVVDNQTTKHLVGLITDRDIVIRCVAQSHRRCMVGDHMTHSGLQSVGPDTDMSEVLALMERHQVRRLPVVNDSGKLIGIISQADIGLALGTAQPGAAAALLHDISMPAPQPHSRREPF